MRSTSTYRLAIALLAALSGACGCGEALASTTYRLGLSGSAVHQLNCWEVPHVCDPAFPPPPTEVIYPWLGFVDLTVASSGDGTFAAPDLLAVDFVSNVASFSVPDGFPPPPGYPLWPFDGSVTIVDGKVTSLDGSEYPDIFGYPELFVSFSGLTAHFHAPAGHHTGSTDASGNLVMVAEPPTWLLLLAAMSLLPALRARSLASALRASLRPSLSPSRSAPAA
jgi:hypothetical protein